MQEGSRPHCGILPCCGHSVNKRGKAGAEVQRHLLRPTGSERRGQQIDCILSIDFLKSNSRVGKGRPVPVPELKIGPGLGVRHKGGQSAGLRPKERALSFNSSIIGAKLPPASMHIAILTQQSRCSPVCRAFFGFLHGWNYRRVNKSCHAIIHKSFTDVNDLRRFGGLCRR